MKLKIILQDKSKNTKSFDVDYDDYSEVSIIKDDGKWYTYTKSLLPDAAVFDEVKAPFEIE